MSKRSDLELVKDWQTIRTEFEAMERMSCVPAGIRKVRADHIFDEERSVRWNREMVEKNNADYQAEVARLNTEKNKRRDAILENIYRLIQEDVGHATYHGSRPSASGRMRGRRAMRMGSLTSTTIFRIWSSWLRCF